MTFTPRDPGAKIKHIEACLLPQSQYQKTTGLEAVVLPNEAGTALSLSEIDLSTSFCDRTFAAPIMISPMTGGVERGAELNALWARAAERYNLPLAVGSQRIALEQGDRAGFFQIRTHAPTAFVFANLGAANLRPATAADLAQRAVDMVQADALFIHFNALQEACQKDGDTDFRDALRSLEVICRALKGKQKIFAREVGFGLTTKAAQRFIEAGVDGVDCAGAGGTSWARVEALCASSEGEARLGHLFGEWGIPTAQSVQNARAAHPALPLIASGGIRSGLDVARAIFLGADMVGLARPFLLAANEGEPALHQLIEDLMHELRVALFAAGKARPLALR